MYPSDTDSCVLRNAVVFTLDNSSSIVEGDLLVEDGTIEAIGDVSTALNALDETDREHVRELDLEGSVVMPGFVQPHIHLCQTLLRNSADDMALIEWLSTRVWPYEAALDADTLSVSARLGLAELVSSGTTTLLDMGTVHHTDAIGEAVADSGIRAFIGKCMMDRDEENVPEALHEETEASLRESRRLCERWDGTADGRIRYAFAPRFALSCTDELLSRTAEAADELDALIHTHCSETEYENEYTREHYGVSNVQHLDELGLCDDHSVFAHGIHVSDDDRRLLADTGTAICHCPSSNLKLASGIADMPRYDRFDVQTALGADGAPCNNNLDPFIEMRLAALIHKPAHGPEAMPAERVLRLATIEGARALGIEDETGSLEVGKSADMVVLDLDDSPSTAPAGSDLASRIVYSAQSSAVEHVFCEGRQLVEGGELVGVDLPELLEEAERARDVVFERMESER